MEHEKEWWDLHRKAYRVLEQSDILPQRTLIARGFAPCFRLWRHPSFEAHFAWHVYRNDDSSEFGIERLIWDLPGDSERFGDPLQGLKHGFHPEPTLKREVIYLAAEILSPSCRRLQRLRLSPVLREPICCFDGERRGIAVGDYWDEIRVSWWGDGPAEWRAVVQWFEQTAALLESHFR
jgi:hypothetical protein